MRLSRKETTTPKGRRVRYNLLALTAAEFNTICKALGLSKEPEAAALLKQFLGLASAPDADKMAEANKALDNGLARLKRILDD